MKNQNKKGFTLVELVIVIAVIAILAGVLIGTFATVISRANQSKAVQEWKARVDEAYVEYVADAHKAPESIKVENGVVKFGDTTISALEANKYLLLCKDSFLELDMNNHVYFNWSNDGEYSVSTTKVENNMLVTIEVYQFMLKDFEDATNVELENGFDIEVDDGDDATWEKVGTFNATANTWTYADDKTYQYDRTNKVWAVS